MTTDQPDSNPTSPAAISRAKAEAAVRLVVSRLTEDLLNERRAPAPDGQRIRELTREHAAAVAVQEDLDDADDEQITNLAAPYVTRARQLGLE